MMFNLRSSNRPTVICDQTGDFVPLPYIAEMVDEFVRHVGSRCLVVCVVQNCIASLVGYIACVQHGHAVLLCGPSDQGKIEVEIVELYRPKFIWCSAQKLVFFSDFVVVWQFGDFCLLRTGFSGVSLHKDLAVLLTTSGSTGSPKFVRLSYKNLLSNAESIVQYIGITPEDRAITSLPMSYSYGLSVVNSHLLAGASIVLTEKSVMQREFWDSFRQHNVTSLSGVPYTYQMLERMRFFGMHLPSLRTLTQAGGQLSTELQQQ